MRTCTYEKCGRKTKSLIKGLCPTCYARFQRNGTAEYVRPNRSFGVTECSFCESKDGPFIKSLCRACYQRQYKNGTPEMQRVRQLCKQPGCDDVAFAHGLCQRHSMRLRRHGDVNAGRPEGWGAKTKHPMYEGWQSMKRISKRAGDVGYDTRWNDFWAYLEDVGERPNPSSRLYRLSHNAPYSKENVEWRDSILEGQVLARNAEYQRAYRLRHPERSKRAYLWKLYKITLEDYMALHTAQRGLCAICFRPEKQKHNKTRDVMMLVVDHDHNNGANRGLLCNACNKALGGFEDSAALLRSAINYLECHAIVDTNNKSP